MRRGQNTCLLASQHTGISIGCETVESFTFNIQVAPIVIVATSQRALCQGALFIETNPCRETHLMSNVPLSKLAISHMAHKKTACALFHGLLTGEISNVAITMSPFVEES